MKTWSDSLKILDKEASTLPVQPTGAAKKIRSKEKQTSNLKPKPSPLRFGWENPFLFILDGEPDLPFMRS
jgi:hypothetical protein